MPRSTVLFEAACRCDNCGGVVVPTQRGDALHVRVSWRSISGSIGCNLDGHEPGCPFPNGDHSKACQVAFFRLNARMAEGNRDSSGGPKA